MKKTEKLDLFLTFENIESILLEWEVGMKSLRFEATSLYSATRDRLWQAHATAGSLERLTPWWSPFVTAAPSPRLRVDEEVVLRARWPFSRIRWTALLTSVKEGRSFTDFALDGPFPFWIHFHDFSDADGGGSLLRDVVLVVPPQWLPFTLAAPLLRIGLRLLFRFRHRRVRRLLERAPRRQQGAPCQMLKQES